MKRALRVAGSLQTGIVLLVLITVCALAGVIIPQGLDAQRYVQRWGTIVGSLMLSAGLDNLFSTLWYNILLGFLALNVLLCTAVRIKASVVSLTRPAFLAPEKIIALPLRAELTGNGSVETTGSAAASFMRKRHYGVAVSSAGDGVLLDARRETLREAGMVLLHLSLLPLLIGGLIGRIAGFSYPQQLGPGESAPVRERSFRVRCDYFKLEKNENGEIRDYKSKLTLLDSAGDSLLSRVIEVNHPLVYKGIKFYQSSYRSDPLKVDSVRLVVRAAAAGPVGKAVVVRPGTPAVVAGTDLTVSVDRFIPDFWIDMETREPKSRSTQHNNPAFLVSVTRAGDTLFGGWVFEKFGAMHHTDDSCSVTLMTYGQQFATGLLVKENPGGPVIWAGIFFMTIGVLLVFWVPRRRIRIAVSSSPAGSKVTAGSGRIRSDPESEQHFSETVAALAAALHLQVEGGADGPID